jgi:hypothetical protein
MYSPESLLALIRSTAPESNDARLRLRSEIRKRISRIDVTFNATIKTAGQIPSPIEITDSDGESLVNFETNQSGEGKTVAKVSFVNGVAKWIFFEGDRAVLMR